MIKHLTKFQNYSLELLPLGSQDTSCASPADIYLLQVNNRNTRTRCEICSKLTIKTPEDMYYYTAIDKELSKKIFFRMLSNLLGIIYQSESRNVFGCHTSVFTL